MPNSGLLVINNNNVANPQTVDLSPYLDVQDGKGMDLADPAFTNKVWSRSLLKEGATLSYEQLTEKELTWPIHLGPVGGVASAPTTLAQTHQLVALVNQIIETPGATAIWQAPGSTQTTTFDVLSGLMEIGYSYWQEAQCWTSANLRLFTQPLGRTAGPRVYAAASGVGPLLMITPYASGGAQIIGASTQAGASGYGGIGQGGVPSSGVFYTGAPSLAGDAPVLLQLSYVGPLPNQATLAGVVPYVAMSVLPDQNYRPLITAPLISSGGEQLLSATAVASQYLTIGTASGFGVGNTVTSFLPVPNGPVPPASWAGSHRLFAIARASGHPGFLTTQPNPLIGYPTTATVYPGDWGLYDLGTFGLRASEAPQSSIQVLTSYTGPQGAIDITAFAMLPDNATWFLNPTYISPSQYGAPILYQLGVAVSPYTNTLMIDDTLGDQFIFGVASQTYAPLLNAGNLANTARITQFTRGLVPRPDPKNGLPIIAFLGVGQTTAPSNGTTGVGASWAGPQNLRTMAQLRVLERARYVLP